MGVIGMNLDDDDEIVGMQLDIQGEALLILLKMALENVRQLTNLRCKDAAVKV